MTKEQGLVLLRKIITDNPGNLHSPDQYLQHTSFMYDFVENTIDHINSRYPWFGNRIKRNEVALAALLHDIGRPLNKDQLFHELRGAKYIEDNGIQLGISDSSSVVFKIAQMIRPHFMVSEQFSDPENLEARRDFENIDPMLLIPRTWQEMIIIYADCSNNSGVRCSFTQSIEKIKDTYSRISWVKRVCEKGAPRLISIYQKVQALVDGGLSEHEALRYGFI